MGCGAWNLKLVVLFCHPKPGEGRSGGKGGGSQWEEDGTDVLMYSAVAQAGFQCHRGSPVTFCSSMWSGTSV